MTIYDEALAPGWADWSWGTGVRLDDFATVQQGARSIAVSFQHPWAGLKFHHEVGVPTSGITTLRLWVHGGARGGQQLQVYLQNGGWTGPAVALPPLGANWTLVELPLAELGSPSLITDVVLHERNGPHREPFFVDALSLTP